MKILYEFKIKDGDKEREFALLKPTRRQREASDMEYSVEYNDCIRRGIMTRTMLAKKYDDVGGFMTSSEEKHRSALYHELKKNIEEQTKLNTTKPQTKKVKEKLLELEKEVVELSKKISEVETSNNYLFSQTAESRAQLKAINWFSLNLLHEKIKKEYEIFFDGESYDEKLDQYYDREEEDDNETYLKIMDRAGTIIALWYFSGGAASADDIDKMIETYVPKEEAEKEPAPETPDE